MSPPAYVPSVVGNAQHARLQCNPVAVYRPRRLLCIRSTTHYGYPYSLTSPWTITVWCCVACPSCSRLRVIGNMAYIQPACINYVHVYPYVHGHVHLFPRRTRERATTWSHPVEQRALHPTYFASLRSWARTALLVAPPPRAHHRTRTSSSVSPTVSSIEGGNFWARSAAACSVTAASTEP